MFKQRIVQAARFHWNNNQAFWAGGVIFETIPVDRRHEWAGEILQIAYPFFPKDAKIDKVLAFAKFPENWAGDENGGVRAAHRIVDEVNRDYSYPLIFHFATQVGKIVYTSQQFPAPFDHSAGWKIAELLKEIVQKIGDEAFEVKAWSALANEDFIVLEKPVVCNPGCPMCAQKGKASVSNLHARLSKIV
jgi:hypothetical protein